MPLHLFLISDHRDKEKLREQLCVVQHHRKEPIITVASLEGLLLLSQMTTYLLCDSWVTCCHCHSAAGKLKLNWFGTVQPGNMHWMEETTRVEKPSCISGKNAQDEKKPCMHTQNTHRSREARKKTVR